jgi:uncharacterized protein (DUF1330 family)
LLAAISCPPTHVGPRSWFTEVMGAPAWRSLPSWYLVAQNDEAIPPTPSVSSARGFDLARPAGSVAFMSAYLVSQVEVLDAEAWEAYRSRAAPAIAAFGGRYLVRGAIAEVIEADWPAEEPPPQTVIVAEFPDMEALHAWYASPAYAEAFAFRPAAVKRRLVFAAGVGDQAAG